MEVNPMMFNDENSVLLRKLMDYSVDRQQVIANNMANANTPGYIRRELDFKEKLAAIVKSGDLKELNGLGSSIVEDNTNAKRLDGGNVSGAKELSVMMENSVFYNLLSRAYNTRVGIIREAIRK